VCLAVERQKVMLTHRIERDIAYQDHLVIAFAVECLDVFIDVPVKSCENLGIHSCNSLGSLQKAFPFRIFTNGFYDKLCSFLYFFLIDAMAKPVLMRYDFISYLASSYLCLMR
jgi:hypothetical protein